MSNVLRDNIWGITKGSVVRLARRAGVKRLGGLIYEEVRGNIQRFLENILRSTVNRVDVTKGTTIKVKHVEPSLDVAMYSSAISDFKCHTRQLADRKEGSTYRHRPGTVALSDIRHYQKTGCLMIARASFNRYVREVAQDFKTGLRLSPKASLLLQYATESYIVTLLEQANLAALHAGHTSVKPKDLQLATRLTNPLKVKVFPTSSNVPVISFDGGIKKVLAQVHPDASIKSDTKSQVNFIINKLASALINSANGLAHLSNKATLSDRHIEAAVREVLPGELSKHAVAEGTKAVTKYRSHDAMMGKEVGVKTSSSVKSGLQFPIGKVRTLLKGCTKLQKVVNDGSSRIDKAGCDRRITATAPIYLAAVLEYVAAEVLELSGNAARRNKHQRITARDLLLAIDNDEELSFLKKSLNVEILGGGTLPNIHGRLLPKKSTKSEK
jgi:histone H2A